jgi:Uma2 family endonuclease
MSPSYSHAAIAAMLITEIHKERKFRAFSELTLLIDGTEYVPDIAVYKWRKVDYLHGDVVRMTELPLLIAEILSPTQRALELYDKAQQVYLPAGVQSVWIVQPLAHTIAVLTQDKVALHHDGVLHDLTGISLDLQAVFED